MMAAKQNNAPEIAAETSKTFTTTDIRQAVAYADIDEHRYALALLIQATWSAAQYEESVLSESAVSHG